MSFDITFIETRIGEPVTALDSFGDHLAFGSISGFYGVLNYSTNKYIFSEKCEIELVRDIKIVKDEVYVLIGDDTILVCDLEDLRLKKNIDYNKYVHFEVLCCNVFTFIDYSKDQLKVLLAYFPTIDTEKMTLEMVQG